jgi:1-hydroxycarotenoid 3,4-desaturase
MTKRTSMGQLAISEQRPVVIVGAGVAGLASALELSANGVPVVVVEAADRPGGKMRRAGLGPVWLDGGPTVLTMRWVFEELFAAAGMDFAAQVRTRPATVLARHAWDGDAQLDLHADAQRSAEEIGRLCGPGEARGFLEFCAEARATYRALEQTFIRAQRPTMAGLVRRIGSRRPADLFAIRPFETLWHALGRYFHDPRMHQLFGRYATYCGSSPYTAPATLMLVAHVEQEGVWLVDSGMFGIAEALERAARARGANFRYGSAVASIATDARGVARVELAGGETLAAGAVIVNADAAALAQGLLGPAGPRALRGYAPARSLSAVTWRVWARTSGFALSRHNVFFSSDYRAEFDAIFARGSLPADATVYVCAQDRNADGDGDAELGRDRLLCLINAPADGDTAGRPDERKALADGSVRRRVFARLERLGLRVDLDDAGAAVEQFAPEQFEQLYPGTGGALYGSATHGWRASFERPGASTGIAGLYLAGGSVHPGPGVPMAALSGRLAAQRVLADR